jgi:hypothetical protein
MGIRIAPALSATYTANKSHGHEWHRQRLVSGQTRPMKDPISIDTNFFSVRLFFQLLWVYLASCESAALKHDRVAETESRNVFEKSCRHFSQWQDR